MIARKALPRPGVSLTEAATALPNTAQPAAVIERIGEPNPTLSVSPAPALPTAAEEVEAVDAMIPIELEDGGLLFTSDPDLPR